MEFKDKLIALKSQRDIKRRQYNESIKRLEQLRQEIKAIDKAADYIKAFAKFTMDDLKNYLSEKVSEAIKIISPELEFEVSFVNKRGSIETEFAVKDTKLNFIADPIDASGGGLADIVSFALRMLFWRLSGEERRNLLILDEPFKFVSSDIKDEELLKAISDLFKIQLIIVSHKEKLISALKNEQNATVFAVKKVDGISRVEKV